MSHKDDIMNLLKENPGKRYGANELSKMLDIEYSVVHKAMKNIMHWSDDYHKTTEIRTTPDSGLYNRQRTVRVNIYYYEPVEKCRSN